MKTILLVEDEALIAAHEAAVLQRNGYKVITAYNAQEAIDKAHGNSINLILMDFNLGPGKMSGAEAARLILDFLDLPIVFLSSHTEKEIVEKSGNILSCGYISKNCGETILITSIEKNFDFFEKQNKLKNR